MSMRHSTIGVTATVALTAMLSASSAAAQTPSFSGVWLVAGNAGAAAGTAAGTEPQMAQWTRQNPVFTPDGLARWTANRPGKGPRQAPPAFGNDPLGDANPPGLLRTLIYGRPIDTIQLPDRIVQLFEYAHFWRTIWTDGRPLPKDAGPYWYGYSVGRFEGDTMVVQTVGLDARAWMDEWGTPFSDDAKITERWRKVDANTVEMTITVDDPRTFAQPWTSDRRTLRLQPKGSANGEVLEVIFAPMDEKEFNDRIRDPAAGRTK
jgi:hypothetical protein